jgi:O-antigen/teichoic acid export membrane protein
MQFMILASVLAGFILFGKNFLVIWMGEKYLGAYPATLLMLLAVTIPSIQGVIGVILDAMLKRLTRSVILVGMAVLNIIFSMLLVKNMGYLGVAISTASSLLIGHGIILNIYYYKVIKINVFRMFREILKGIFPCTLFSMLLSLPMALCLPNTSIMFLIKLIVYLNIYIVMIYYFGINNSEKKAIHIFFKKYIEYAKMFSK